MSEFNPNKFYLVRITTYDGSTVSIIEVDDTELFYFKSFMFRIYNHIALTEHDNASWVEFHPIPFSTEKEAKEFLNNVKNNLNHITWERGD